MSKHNCCPEVTMVPLHHIGLGLDLSGLDREAGLGEEDIRRIIREELAAAGSVALPQVLYVSAERGDDDNDGLSEDTPFATMLRAFEELKLFRGTGACEVNVESGTYSVPSILLGWELPLALTINGGTGEKPVFEGLEGSFSFQYQHYLSVINIHFNDCVSASTTTCILSDCRITGRTSTTVALMVNSQAHCIVQNSLAIVRGASTKPAIRAQGGSVISLSGNAKVSISGSVTTDRSIVESVQNSLFKASSVATMSGSVSGRRYAVAHNSTIIVPGGSASYIPGTVAGNASLGGIYAAS